MKLSVKKREAKTKGESNQIRRAGDIPAVLYSKGQVGENITVDGSQFHAILRGLKPGHLPTTIVSLTDEDGKERKAIVKDIQYHVTTYDVLHLDFEELHEDTTVDVKIPIHFTGREQCVGIKLGGVLRQVIRHYKVRCLPKDIPSFFELNVRELGMKQSKRLGDIELPEGVKPLSRKREVAVTIAKR